jgi:hypothetical protein
MNRRFNEADREAPVKLFSEQFFRLAAESATVSEYEQQATANEDTARQLFINSKRARIEDVKKKLLHALGEREWVEHV